MRKRCLKIFALYKSTLKFVPLGCGHLIPKGLHLNKVKSPCPKDAPQQISMHSGQWFIRFIKFVLILPHKGPASLFEQILIPISKAYFLPSLVVIGIVVLEKLFKKIDARQMDAGLPPSKLKITYCLDLLYA